MTRCLLLLALFLATTAFARALPQSAAEAAARLVELNNHAALQSAEAKAMLRGELTRVAGPGDGSLPAPDRVLAIGADTAVARIPAGEGNPDLYLYLKRVPEGWTVTALRSLALTGVLAEMVRLDRAHPSTDPEVRRAVANAELVLSPDRRLLEWAAAHRDLLERARREPGSPEVQAALEAAGGLQVSVREGMTVVTIGGILDNAVGFLWAPPDRVPAIDPSNYIWIEPAGGGWYLFKTT